MLELRRVGLLLRDREQEYPLDQVQEIFGAKDIELTLLDPEANGLQEIDLVIAMGGDGTVLQALAMFPQVPTMAINYGTVGFLTAGDRSDLRRIVSLLISGQFVVSDRLALECRYQGGTRRVINEVIVRAYNRFLFADVYVGDTKIRTIKGDGVVVGTPTGSTGFLLSTGAPIVMPDVRCMVLDGVNEHNFSSRALILPPESHIRLSISAETRDPHIYLTVDGHQLGDLSPGEDVHITQSSNSAKLIYFEPNYFFNNLTSKLSW